MVDQDFQINTGGGCRNKKGKSLPKSKRSSAFLSNEKTEVVGCKFYRLLTVGHIPNRMHGLLHLNKHM